MHDYELFSIKNFESIVEMFSRFIVIVNELEALGKTYRSRESHEDLKVSTKEIGNKSDDYSRSEGSHQALT